MGDLCLVNISSERIMPVGLLAATQWNAEERPDDEPDSDVDEAGKDRREARRPHLLEA